jgi:hypothetical protein
MANTAGTAPGAGGREEMLVLPTLLMAVEDGAAALD